MAGKASEYLSCEPVLLQQMRDINEEAFNGGVDKQVWLDDNASTIANAAARIVAYPHHTAHHTKAHQ
jgi:hypothetical protein